MSVFGIRHKNKRQLGIHSHRRLFVALFLFGILAVSAITTFVLNVNAQLVPVASIKITSSHTNFDNGENGSWKVTKSAEWIDTGKARITFEVNSIPKYDNSKKLDVVMVIDNSGSMSGDKIAQVKTDAIDLIDTVLSDPDNKISLITFNTTATILSGLTSNKNTLIDYVENITTPGSTNYYDGLLKAAEVLQGYGAQDNRELVLLFLTDGYPNEQTPNEIAQYRALKKAYPYMIINGIQYEMGDTILQPIIDISDNQFIADMSSLNNVLFEATIIPYAYEEFKLSDYIEDYYWTVAGLEAIEASLGEVGLEYDGSTPKVTWDMNGLLRSGKSATLTIEVDLKQEFYDEEGLLLPTNKHEEVETKIKDVPDEDIDSPDTPVLRDAYDVIYDANAPEGCLPSGTVPETISHTVFTTVEYIHNQLSCPGYAFKGWTIVTSKVELINDDYFRMPSYDVYIKALWARPEITKSMNGSLHTRASATFDEGDKVAQKMKRLSGQTSASYSTKNTTITAIQKADVLPTSFDHNDDSHILSSSNSQLKIYGWFDEGTLYYYSDADDIYLNRYAAEMFYRFAALTDISGLRYIDSSKADSLFYMFYGNESLVDIDALADWNTSNVTSLSGLFSAAKSLENVDALSKWNTSKVTNMSSLFYCYGGGNLSDINGLRNWDTSNVKEMIETFYGASIHNVDALQKWDVSKVESMQYMFNGTALTDLSGIRGWDTSKVTNMRYMFSASRSLVDISPLGSWNVSAVKNMSNMFSTTKVENIDNLVNWNVSSVEDMSKMFAYTNLNSLYGARNWIVSNVKNMSGMFYQTKLVNVVGAENWNTGNVTDMSEMFVNISTLISLQGAERWDVSKVQNMQATFSWTQNFSDCSALSGWITSSLTTTREMFFQSGVTNIDCMSGWDMSKVTTTLSMFQNAYHLASISGAREWKLNSLTEARQMFNAATSLTSLDGAEKWDVSHVTTMGGMFGGCTSLSDISQVSSWNTSNVTNMNGVFLKTNITNVNALTIWDVSNVTNLSGMFRQTFNLQDISGLAGWVTSNVTDMSELFSAWLAGNENQLTDLSPLANWDTSNVVTMQEMFESSKHITNLDALTEWKTPKLENMRGMFEYCGSLSDIKGLKKWDTSRVTDMHGLFYGSSIPGYGDIDITNVDDLSEWDTSSVTDMSSMFYENNKLTDIKGLKKWKTGNVTDMSSMFFMADLRNLEPIREWDTAKVENMYQMFYYNQNIESLEPIFGWDTQSLTDADDMFIRVPSDLQRPAWYEALVNP